MQTKTNPPPNLIVRFVFGITVISALFDAVGRLIATSTATATINYALAVAHKKYLILSRVNDDEAFIHITSDFVSLYVHT